VSERCALIRKLDVEKAGFPIIKMCAWLGVPRSTYYEHLNRQPSTAQQRREAIKARVCEIHDEMNQTYGHRRMAVQLRNEGWDVCDEFVRQLMREAGLVTCHPAPWRPVTTLAASQATRDLLGGTFTAEAPGRALVGDITYIGTGEGWLYLATVIDCHTKEVIGWATANHMRAELVCDALRMAARNYPLEKDCIFHSDRGVQYTSDEYRRLLRDLRMRPSVGRTGVCWDNAMAESFFASLKKELVHRTTFATRREARDAIANYIEIFYNRRRLHSGIGYRTPCQVYWHYQLAQAS
jgi:putative transposase